MTPEAAGSCRSDLARWYAPEDSAQRARLDAWCAGVGPTTMFNGAVQPAGSISPNDIAFVSWNVHEGNGRLRAFVEDLRAGRLTNGRAPQHFVLLLQEAVRTTGVPSLTAGARGARRIAAAHQDAEDIQALASDLGLSLLYAPSMRNGNAAGDPNGDRGNAILSTLPLSDPMAIELPFERQRRVALFAHVAVSAVESLPVGVIHLDATDAAKHLWVFNAELARHTGQIVGIAAAGGNPGGGRGFEYVDGPRRTRVAIFPAPVWRNAAHGRNVTSPTPRARLPLLPWRRICHPALRRGREQIRLGPSPAHRMVQQLTVRAQPFARLVERRACLGHQLPERA